MTEHDSGADAQYVEVAVHEPVHQLFTYSLPADLRDRPVGGLVEVPFGHRQTQGCIVRYLDELPPELKGKKIRSVSREITPGYYISGDILALALWMGAYYMAPPGDCCSCVSFIGLNDIASQVVKRYVLTETGLKVANGVMPGRVGAKQADVLNYLAKCEGEPMTMDDIAQMTGASMASVKSLVGKGWVEVLVREVVREDDYRRAAGGEAPLTLSEEQTTVFGEICGAMDRRAGQAFLLHGVTGSGKTEIYLQAIEKALAEGGEAIVLVPEISLTPQTVDRFRRRFGNVVGVYHSRLTLGQKFDLWKGVVNGRVRIMVGARSALFTPFENLRVVVVDEEHELTYKQDSSPRYHARDLAIKRCVDVGAVCILGSATPAIESYYKALQGKFTLLRLTERIDGKPLPAVTVVDMTNEVHEEGNPEFLSRSLLKAMGEAVGNGEQVLLFLNRRGFFNFVICLQCHEALKCHHCDVALTYHRITNKLMCHYCGAEYVMPKRCPSCEEEELNMIGLGTERLEEIVQQTFASARVLRLDLDTTRKRNAFMEAWDRLERNEVDIVLGTQMIAKGLHLENVTVVGLPLADGALYQPDFRATERAFGLMTQVAGRAGRGRKPGRVFLQTYVPHHYAVQFAQAHDYVGFYKKEIRVREVLRFPPFYRLIALLMTGRKEDETAETVKDFARLLKGHAHRYGHDVMVLGPSPAPVSRINDQYRWRLLMRSREQSMLRDVLRRAFEEFDSMKGKSRIVVVVDVDPMDLL